MGVEVSLTREHVWMFHLNHAAFQRLVRANPKDGRRDERAARQKRWRDKQGKTFLGDPEKSKLWKHAKVFIC